MEIIKKVKDGITIFHLNGTINFFSAGEVEETLLKGIKEDQLSKAVFNLKNVSYLDSLGIGTLLNVITKKKKDVKIRMCEIAETTIHVLHFTGFTTLLLIDKTEEESIRKLNRDQKLINGEKS